jgi:hypothetical protein
MTERLPDARPERRSSARRAGAAALTAALLLSSAAMAATRCPDEQHQAMHEVAALKTELLVVALACKQEDRYNEFVTRFRSYLGENDKALLRYYTGTRGRAGQRDYDAYVTNLANARAKLGQELGSDFCPRNSALFAEVMSLSSGNELPAYAAGKDLVPANLGACAAQPTVPAAAASRSRGR